MVLGPFFLSCIRKAAVVGSILAKLQGCTLQKTGRFKKKKKRAKSLCALLQDSVWVLISVVESPTDWFVQQTEELYSSGSSMGFPEQQELYLKDLNVRTINSFSLAKWSF